MKIINSGLEKEVNILSYFSLHDNNKYVFYTETDKTIINLARVNYEDEKIILNTDFSEDMDDIKVIIKNLVSDNPNTFVFNKKEYKYIYIEELDDKIIEEKKSQKIQLDNEKYQNFITNKCLCYPFGNLERINKSKEATLRDMVSSIIAGVILLLIIGGLIAYHFDFNLLRNNLFDINYILENLIEGNFYIDNFLIIKLSVVSLVFAILSFGVSENHPLLFWLTGTLLLLIIYIIWGLTQNIITFEDGFYPFIKEKTIYLLFVSLIFMAPYFLCKEVSLLINKTIKISNFISYYTVYFIMFTFSFIGLGLFYHYYLFDHITKLVEKIM